MMRRILALALCVFALAALPAFAAGSSDNDKLRATLKTRYDLMQTATDKRDGKALGDLLAPGFETVSMGNETKGRDQMIRDIGAMGPKKPGTATSTVINDIRRVDDRAYVDETYRLDRVNPPRKGIAHKWRLVTNVNDTWVKIKDDWLLQKSVANMTDVYLDGLHMAHQVRGKKMMWDKAYKKQMKEKALAAPHGGGGSCGGGEISGTTLPQSTSQSSCDH